MCIIAYKKQGVAMPKRKMLKRLWDKNPDGAGYMIKRKNANIIILEKGFMQFNDFYFHIMQENITVDDEVVMHFRIETSGGVTPNLTHPFVVSEKEKIVKKVSIRTNKICFAHNGIIPYLNGIEKDNSDTSIFARDILSDPLIYNNIFKNPAIQELIEGYIDGSRMIFMKPDEDTIMIGKWHEKDGVYYSNEGFKKPKYTSKYKYGRYDWYDDYNFNDINNVEIDDDTTDAETICDSCSEFCKTKFYYQYNSFICDDCAEAMYLNQ